MNENKKYTEFLGYISQEECGYDAGKTILYDTPYPMTLAEANEFIKKNKIKQNDLLIGKLSKGRKNV